VSLHLLRRLVQPQPGFARTSEVPHFLRSRFRRAFVLDFIGDEALAIAGRQTCFVVFRQSYGSTTWRESVPQSPLVDGGRVCRFPSASQRARTGEGKMLGEDEDW
jgi:hypothetical protein